MVKDEFTIGQEVVIQTGYEQYELAKITGETATRWKVGDRQFYKTKSQFDYNNLHLVGNHGIKLIPGKPTPELRKKVAATIQFREDAEAAKRQKVKERKEYDAALAEWRATPAGIAQTARSLHLEGLDVRIDKREDERYRKATISFVGAYYPDHTADPDSHTGREKIQWGYQYASVEVTQYTDYDWDNNHRVFWKAPEIRCSFTAPPQASMRLRQLLEEAEIIALKWDVDTNQDIVKDNQGEIT